MGFCVAITRNNAGSGYVCRPTVTWRSPIASSSADCTLAGARLISSANSNGWKMGPAWNSNRPSWGRQTSVPVRSAGNRSGVNCTRAKSACSREARARMAVVLARPGAPSTSRWPSASRAISRRSTSAAWPTMVCDRSSRRRVNASCRRACASPDGTGLQVGTESMDTAGIDGKVDSDLPRQGRFTPCSRVHAGFSFAWRKEKGPRGALF